MKWEMIDIDIDTHEVMSLISNVSLPGQRWL